MLVFTIQNTAFAETEKIDFEKIHRLENLVENLEDRVGRLEKYIKQPNAVLHQEEKIDPKVGWKYRHSWSQLEEGMSASQAEAILGHPTRIDDMGKGFKKFFYWGEIPTGIISGYLEIYDGSIYKIYIPEFHE